MEASVASSEELDMYGAVQKIVYTATVEFEDSVYTDVKETTVSGSDIDKPSDSDTPSDSDIPGGDSDIPRDSDSDTPGGDTPGGSNDSSDSDIPGGSDTDTPGGDKPGNISGLRAAASGGWPPKRLAAARCAVASPSRAALLPAGYTSQKRAPCTSSGQSPLHSGRPCVHPSLRSLAPPLPTATAPLSCGGVGAAPRDSRDNRDDVLDTAPALKKAVTAVTVVTLGEDPGSG